MKDEKYLQISHILYDFLIKKGIDSAIASYINVFFNILILLLITFIIDRLAKKLLVKVFHILAKKTKSHFDDYLIQEKFPKYVAHIFPFIIITNAIRFIFEDFTETKTFLLTLTDLYFIILMLWIIRSFLNGLKKFFKNKVEFKDKPIESFAQIIMIVIWGIGIILIFSFLTGKSAIAFLTTVGAASTVLLLIFKDTILGFVASIQVSINDLVKIGDWITQDKYGADGDVIEITLTTVKVQNFDNTISTIPTYSLISDSFRNWRGMKNSSGRRIKRAIYFKQDSIKFLNETELNELSKIQLIESYLKDKQKEIIEYNLSKGLKNNINPTNGRNQTNLGLYRKYCDLYLKKHPKISDKLLVMTRHLDPTPNGLPLQIYAFSSDKNWENYERIMADIFEHLIATTKHFKLEIFEHLSNSNN